MPHRLVALFRSRPPAALRPPTGAPGYVLSVLAFITSLLIVVVAVLTWAALKSYVLCERLAWQMARRFGGF